MTEGARARVEAPAGLTPLEVAQAVVGPHVLLKAEPVGTARTFQDDKVMRQLAKRWERAYRQQLDKLLSRVRGHIEDKIIHGPLGKADGKAPRLSPAEIMELRQLIVDYHLAFIAGTVGPDTLRPGEVQRLIDAGFLPQDLAFTFQPGAQELPPAAMNAIEDAYRYGHVLGRAAVPYSGRQRKMFKRFRNQLTYEQFGRKWAPQIPLTAAETQAVDWARQSAAVHIVGLGNRVADDFSTIAIEADRELRQRYMGTIREAVAENIERRDSWRQIVSEIGNKTGDWSRDFGRIAATEKQKAMQEGQAAAMIKRLGDPEDIRVAKQPNPDACPDCIRLHHTAGPGSPLRIFKMSELVAAGTNVGLRRRDWNATVGPVHPWCGCEIIEVPPGMVFDEENNLVPELITRSDWLEHDLIKAMPKDPPKAGHLTYANAVPEDVLVVRVGDPRMRAEIDKVIAQTPPEIFDKRVGVTLITTETPRVANPLEEHDYAYWTGNEIRIHQTLPPEKIWRVLRHELGHSLNVHLMRKMGGVKNVRAWHDKLWAVSKREGFVSHYATKLPIENAAEVSMMYLYYRPHFMSHFPMQFGFVHREYKDIWEKAEAA
jgi:hypothetical protein